MNYISQLIENSENPQAIQCVISHAGTGQSICSSTQNGAWENGKNNKKRSCSCFSIRQRRYSSFLWRYNRLNRFKTESKSNIQKNREVF
jgi:hypothetical protein